VNLGQLAKAVAARFNLPEGQARELLAFALETMAGNLRVGRRVYFRDFGAFVKRIRPDRRVRHPRTGEIILIPGGPAVRFSASPALLRKVADAKPRRTAAHK
jgi:DNA-binding protein HU-beta